MSRKRDLSTDISHDERIAELSESEHGYLAVALYMMAIPQADDWGRLPGSPREFKMLVCPGFDTPKQEIDAVLSEIAALGLWERYEIDGKKCIAFPPDAWFKRQTYINTSKRTNDTGSLYPANQQFLEYSATQSAEKQALDQSTSKERQETTENGKEQHYAGASPSPSLSPSLSEDSFALPSADASRDEQEKEPDEAQEKQSKPPRSPLLLRFDRFYAAYPRKRSPGDAEKAWMKIKPDEETTQAMLVALSWQVKSREWTKDSGQYVPYPASYLSDRAWLNEPDTPLPSNRNASQPALVYDEEKRVFSPAAQIAQGAH